MARVLVVLPTSSYRTADYVAAAERLGVELAVASEEHPPLPMGDRFVAIDCGEVEASVEAIVELAVTSPIDAVVAADDAGVVIAARASQRLGLAHHSPEAAAATRHKLDMRRLLAQAEVPQPAFLPVGDDLGPVSELGYPLVVKPLTATASRGVLRVDRAVDLAGVVERVRRIAGDAGDPPGAPLLAERYVPGDEVAVEAVVRAGQLTVLAVFDKPDPMEGPTFEETILVTPSSHPPVAVAELERVVAAGVAAIGLHHGPIHAEARIHQGRVVLLEVAARSIGGLCGRTLRFGLMGRSLEELVLAEALGLDHLSMARQPRASGVMMVPIDREGVLDRVEGVAEAEAVEGVSGVEITIPSGAPLVPLPEGDRYLGFIFAAGRTPAEVVSALRQAHALLRIVVR